MTDLQQKHPLHGLGLEALLNELVEHYDWEILAEQIPIKCFSTYPSIPSCVKFLRKTTWARERVEAFYLYRFKRISLPTEEQHKLPPREREISEDQLGRTPSSINLGDSEFFDDPDTGPVFKKQSRRDKPVKDKPVKDKPVKDKPVKDESVKDESVKDESVKDESVKDESVKDTNVSSNEITSEPQDKPTDTNQTSSTGKADPWGKWR